MLSGVVEADETMIGGRRPGKRGRGAEGKTVVFGMIERDGDVMTKVVPDVRRTTLHPIIEGNVEQGSTINTDELKSYNGLSAKGYEHQRVNHGRREFAKGNVHVNSIESYWAQLQRGVSGAHIHVSGKHLEKYAKEFEYRFNSRKNPGRIFPELLSTFLREQDDQ